MITLFKLKSAYLQAERDMNTQHAITEKLVNLHNKLCDKTQKSCDSLLIFQTGLRQKHNVDNLNQIRRNKLEKKQRNEIQLFEARHKYIEKQISQVEKLRELAEQATNDYDKALTNALRESFILIEFQSI